jgi:hypothetical protein
MSEDDDKVVNLRSGPEALRAFIETTSFGGGFSRPFLGQKWTFTGERGAKPLPKLRYRDLGDLLVGTVARFALNEVAVTGGCDVRRMDLDALAQMLLARIEENE